MEMILISDSKLKVMLTPLDMEEFALDGDEIDCSDADTRLAFRHILDKAKQATGFDAENKRVYIQIFPSRSGGCELYVTKICGTDGESVKSDRACPHSAYSIRRIDGERRRKVNENKTKEPVRAVYSFVSLDLLTSVCRILDSRGFDGDSSVHRDADKYYLELSYFCKQTDQYDKNTDHYPFIAEFGSRIDTERAHLYFGEHCGCICDGNAVRILAAIG